MAIRIAAAGPDEIATVAMLLREYADGLGVDLEFQNFAAELRDLPGAYRPPAGRLLVARVGDQAAGCVAVRPLAADVAELKRLYVRPAWRGYGIGRALTEAAIEAARAIGYRRLRLDTLPGMTSALALYTRLGFRPIAPYRDNPVPGARFLELDLGVPRAPAAPRVDRPRTTR
jgi:GNAT superfamily N-acetyltransferase